MRSNMGPSEGWWIFT